MFDMKLQSIVCEMFLPTGYHPGPIGIAHNVSLGSISQPHLTRVLNHGECFSLEATAPRQGSRYWS
jgi:hypothetical protein